MTEKEKLMIKIKYLKKLLNDSKNTKSINNNPIKK